MSDERHCLVAYLDVYGFSSLPQDINLSNLTTTIVEIGEDLRAEIAKKRTMQLHLFSDSAFISLDISKAYEEQDIDSLNSMLRSFFEALRKCYDAYLQRRLLLRGGVAFGKVVRSPSILIGEPVIETVRLEQAGLAPLILVPASMFDKLGCEGWPGLIQIPMKHERAITALALTPRDVRKYSTRIREMRDDACYYMTPHSGPLTAATKIVECVLDTYGKKKP